MKIITQTDRLILREFIADDTIHLYQMNNDHEVIEYTGDSPFSNIEDASQFLKNYKEYSINNMGRWVVSLKSSHEFLGWCGLKYHPEEKIVEVGFRFYQKNWNKGYATESAKASIEYGFKSLKLTKIFAHAHIENHRSHQVIKNCGLKFMKRFDYDGIPANLYKIDNPYLSIKKIKAEETYPVRHPVLREGRPVEDCKFDKDNDPDTFHLGLFVENELLGIVTYLKNNLEELTGSQFQLRGMAVLKEYQTKGFGNLLIKKGEEIIKKEQGNAIWCNAREVAINFYKKNGFKIIGKPFVIPRIGLHYMMYKEI